MIFGESGVTGGDWRKRLKYSTGYYRIKGSVESVGGQAESLQNKVVSTVCPEGKARGRGSAGSRRARRERANRCRAWRRRHQAASRAGRKGKVGRVPDDHTPS